MNGFGGTKEEIEGGGIFSITFSKSLNFGEYRRICLFYIHIPFELLSYLVKVVFATIQFQLI